MVQLAVDYPKNKHGLTCTLVERCLIKQLSNSGLTACLGQAASDNADPVAVCHHPKSTVGYLPTGARIRLLGEAIPDIARFAPQTKLNCCKKSPD